MKPLVLQLQEDLVTGTKKMQELLRLAKLIAAKLQVGSLEYWIECEITGYPHNERVPDYRNILGSYLEMLNPMRGWIPVSGTGRITIPIHESISELGAFLKEDVVQYQPGTRVPVTDITGSDILSGFPQRVKISTTSFRRIIEHVRNRLLEWALELEKKGVLGENMSFNETEKQTAQNITVNNIEKFTGVLGNVSHSHFAIHDYSSMHKTIKECGVPVTERNQLEEIMDGLKEGDAAKKKGWAKPLVPEMLGAFVEHPGFSMLNHVPETVFSHCLGEQANIFIFPDVHHLSGQNTESSSATRTHKTLNVREGTITGNFSVWGGETEL